ncbi:hypothetical protein [Actinoplanes sp. NPDC049599]
MREIGVLLQAKAMHPGRATVSHLLALPVPQDGRVHRYQPTGLLICGRRP